jgi:hypothetical protein
VTPLIARQYVDSGNVQSFDVTMLRMALSPAPASIEGLRELVDLCVRAQQEVAAALATGFAVEGVTIGPCLDTDPESGRPVVSLHVVYHVGDQKKLSTGQTQARDAALAVWTSAEFEPVRQQVWLHEDFV